jgi:hypothetical protein
VNRETPVVEVGPDTLTAADILAQAGRLVAAEPSGDSLADWKRRIEPIVQARLLVLEARARGFEDDPLRRQLKRTERDLLVRELERVEIREKLVVDPAAVEEAVRRAGIVLHLRQLEAPTQAAAESLRARLVAGESTPDLTPAALRWGESWPALEEVAYGLKPGEIGGPVAAGESWRIVKLDSASIHVADPESLTTAVEGALETAAFNRGQVLFLDEMKTSLRYTVIESTVNLFLSRLTAWDSAGAPEAPRTPGADRFGFTAGDRARAMFTYEGGEFTIADFSDYMADQPAVRVRQRTERERVDRDLDQYFRHHAYADRARARGYLELSGLASELERARERALIHKLYTAQVALPAPPEDADLRAHHAAHPERFDRSFEDSRDQVQADLVALREEERYAALIVQLKGRYPITYHDDALRRLRF